MNVDKQLSKLFSVSTMIIGSGTVIATTFNNPATNVALSGIAGTVTLGFLSWRLSYLAGERA